MIKKNKKVQIGNDQEKITKPKVRVVEGFYTHVESISTYFNSKKFVQYVSWGVCEYLVNVL